MREWSTDTVAARESFAFWNDAVCDAFLRVRTECTYRSAFRGRITSFAAGPLLINNVQSQAHLVRRNRFTTSRDSDAWFFVNLHTGGTCTLRQAGRDHMVGPGDISFHDSVRPFDLDFCGDMALTCFIVPRAALLARTVDAPDAAARPLGDNEAGALFTGFARTLARVAPSLSASQSARAGAIFVDLLALTLGANASGRETGRAALRSAQFARVRAEVAARLGDPRLDLPGLAARVAIAPRTLQTLFREHGTTFTDYVLEERLQSARTQLQARTNAPITELAYAVGFSDLSQFSRAFRRRFGITARDARAGCDKPGTGSSQESPL